MSSPIPTSSSPSAASPSPSATSSSPSTASSSPSAASPSPSAASSSPSAASSSPSAAVFGRSSSYRPHNPGHDYYAPGIYLITLVVRNRREQAGLFGRLNDDPRHPAIELSDVGHAVMRSWEEIPAFEASKGRKVAIHRAVCMPDHFHGVIEVKERMGVSVGQVIWGFKVACTKRWRQLCSQPMTADTPAFSSLSSSAAASAAVSGSTPAPEPIAASAASSGSTPAPGSAASSAAVFGSTPAPGSAAVFGCVPAPDLHRLSKKQRAAYYAAHPEAQQPLWDDNYDDTICLSDPVTGAYSQRHFSAMLQYVDDNVRRAIMRRRFPQFMQRCLHVRIAGKSPDGRVISRDYAAFGNLFLLRWAKKVQVFSHRKARLGQLSAEERQRYGYTYPASPDLATRIPYESTIACRQEHDAWMSQVMAGATVIVTPGISRGEQLMKEECLTRGLPLIHLQKEPIGPYWKPEKSRFDACSRGSLLILAPWKAEEMGEVNGVPSATDYSIFHNLNSLAEEICAFEGEMEVVSIR